MDGVWILCACAVYVYIILYIYVYIYIYMYVLLCVVLRRCVSCCCVLCITLLRKLTYTLTVSGDGVSHELPTASVSV